MATRQEEPKLKGRNFKKAAKEGVRTVQSVALRGRSRASSQGRPTFIGEEEVPDWEKEARQSSTVSTYVSNVCVWVLGLQHVARCESVFEPMFGLMHSL